MHHRNNKWEVWGLESRIWDRVAEWLKNGLMAVMGLTAGYALIVMVFCM